MSRRRPFVPAQRMSFTNIRWAWRTAHTIDALTAAGIGYGIYYPIPIHKQEIYLARGYDVTLPVAEAASERVVAAGAPRIERSRVGAGC